MKKRFLIIAAAALCLVLLFASCEAKTSYDRSYPTASDERYNGGGFYEDPNDSAEKLPEKKTVETDADGKEIDPALEQKLIKTVTMRLETTDFDTFAANLDALIRRVGGYVENSSVSKSGYNSLRTGSYVLRVPAEKLDEFSTELKGSANLLSYNETAEDVTLTYADIEGRLTALRAEQTALNSMLEKAENISDIISIQSRLTSVRGEIESYESRLRVLSSKVSYSTVSVSLQEVEKVTVDEKKLTVWEEIGERFGENGKKLGEYLREIFVTIVGGLPTFASVLITLFLIFAPQAVIALIVVAIVKSARKKKAAKAAAAAAQTPPPQNYPPRNYPPQN